METDTATDEVVTYSGDRYEFDYPKYITVDDSGNVRIVNNGNDLPGKLEKVATPLS